jgi:hypothetical protein
MFKAVDVEGATLESGDAISFEGGDISRIFAKKASEILLFDLA